MSERPLLTMQSKGPEVGLSQSPGGPLCRETTNLKVLKASSQEGEAVDERTRLLFWECAK